MVQAILYKLKTGCQWRQLPLKALFEGPVPCWQTVFHYFNKWANDGSFQEAWTHLLSQNRSRLDLSCIQLDGSHTPAKNGGQAVGYQGRKKASTTNMLFVADNQGTLLACSDPQSGEHNDLFGIQALFDSLCQMLQTAGLRVDGLFLNADAGFDSTALRAACAQQQIQANIRFNPRRGPSGGATYVYFDEVLYQRRVVIERSNAWLDGFKALLVRFETKASNWLALHILAFCALFMRRLASQSKL